MTDTPPNSCPSDARCMLKLMEIQTVCNANKEALTSMDKLLRGNGEAPGLKTRVDRLEQTSKLRGWWSRAAATTCFSVTGAVVLWLVTNWLAAE